ncbi:hypothetical protein LWP59_36025 [Amycolatopsis acidiphila]|uniref:Uncharacterized protein n=1 Tax=Amycolatopsis acidiphila TaxID=715473 RepID=A0A558ABE6_9PSEU|nr:hypothetical protein [Amycolatopsis acidiphila]TVT21573.1 hypothetical protein FNH06_16540 [Amycolatopsis acidiphila]UIJ59392.1 hypothetical protein LWP59_36025 [Amycolatopsis acidiphila]GHG96971.1 hypothetical protein GCM10017788_76230 [Amycolatopsis acidiphila]
MDTNAYVAFLVVGILMVVIDGQVIYHSGKRYLENSKGNPEAESSMTRLIAVLFHLVVLGALALLSTIHFPGGSSLPSIVGRLGVMLLVIALAHAIAISVLARMREEQAVEDFNSRVLPDQSRAPIDRQLSEPTVQPVPGQDGRIAHVSPNLEHGGPYSPGDGRL